MLSRLVVAEVSPQCVPFQAGGRPSCMQVSDSVSCGFTSPALTLAPSLSEDLTPGWGWRPCSPRHFCSLHLKSGGTPPFLSPSSAAGRCQGWQFILNAPCSTGTSRRSDSCEESLQAGSAVQISSFSLEYFRNPVCLRTQVFLRGSLVLDPSCPEIPPLFGSSFVFSICSWPSEILVFSAS